MDETEIRPLRERGAQPLPNGYVLDERYTVTMQLGEGGFGVTYLAKHNLLEDKLVAIKEYLPRDYAVRDNTDSLHPRSEADLLIFDWGLKSFIDEGNRLYRLTRDHRHSGIVAVEDVFEANHTAYMVMEHVEGQTLRKLIDAGPISEEQLLQVTRQVLGALETVHNAGLVHRDVTPSNILIRDDNGLPVLIDFGSAREDFDFSPRKTRTNNRHPVRPSSSTPGMHPSNNMKRQRRTHERTFTHSRQRSTTRCTRSGRWMHHAGKDSSNKPSATRSKSRQTSEGFRPHS